MITRGGSKSSRKRLLLTSLTIQMFIYLTQNLNTFRRMEFAIGAIAAMCGGFFTNPLDVIKTRLQLEAELEAQGSYRKIYRNTFHAASVIARHEGILALQSGLIPALGFQMVLNGIRLGGYNLAKRYELIVDEAGQMKIFRSLLISAGSGGVGSALASPLYLVKMQLQTQYPGSIFGSQQTGAWSAFRTMWRKGGIRELYRGCHLGVPRMCVGSCAQLTSYNMSLDWLKRLEVFKSRSTLSISLASLISGTSVALTIQPFDVAAMRMYNQKFDPFETKLYNGLFETFGKILKTEGITGLYKGMFPLWLRITPHTVLCLVFYEKFNHYYEENFR